MDHDGLLTEFYASHASFGSSLFDLQNLTSRIIHRYQRMNILEIGGGTGGATKHIIGIPQATFDSYTFTDISSSFFDKARETFAKDDDRIDFRTLDISQISEKQGFALHQYDLIVASNVLHATPSLQESMKNVRSLLKPGGRLVVVELTHRKHSRIGFIFGLFPDWWAGQDEGRIWEPFVDLHTWDEILKRTGFSGIDSRTSDRDAALRPTSCFSTHAVTTHILQLDNPLCAPSNDKDPVIVVIGDDSSWTETAIRKLKKTLPHRRFCNVKCLRAINEITLEPRSTFLVLSELDDEMFVNLDEYKCDAIKSIFRYAAHVLWVTENAWEEHPYQAMVIGFLRSIRLEHPDISTQVLDVDCRSNLSTDLLAEQLLRVELGSSWQKDGLVWTQEPEIYLSGNRLMIPRVKHDVARNERLNSTRRPILADVHVSGSFVSLRRTEKITHLECINPKTDASLVNVKAGFVLAKSIRVGNLGYSYLIQGTDTASDRAVIALSQENASAVQVPASQVFDLNPTLSSECVLLSIAAEILAQSIASQAAPGSVVLILEPPHFCIKSFAGVFERTGVAARFVSAHPTPMPHSQWVCLQEKETRGGLLAKAVTPDISVFYDFSTDQSSSGLGRRLATCLPPTCLVYRTDDLAQDIATSLVPASRTCGHTEMLERAVTAATPISSTTPVVSVDQLIESNDSLDISTVVNWQASQTQRAN